MYEQIARNRRASLLLVLGCVLLLEGLGAVFALAAGTPYWVGLPIATAIATFLLLLSFYGGDRIVLTVSRARPLTHEDNPRLFNVVEEMSIAAGLPMPKVYLIEDEAPNAFATGRKPETASIAVTRGLLEKLNRDELQGVIAHEMAHIQNHDILFATLMAVLVGTVALLCDAFLRGFFYGRRVSRRRSGGQPLFLLLGLILALLAPLFAKLIELAVSRRREFLADASAALLTRYPPGLASALEKISQDRSVLEVANRATQHLYIVNPIKSFEERARGLFDTHPPIRERIRRLREMSLEVGLEPPTASRPSAPTPVAAGREVPPTPEGLGLVSSPASAATVAPRPPVRGLLQPQPDACPRCREELSRGRLAGRPLRGCRHCGGLWLQRADLLALLRRAPKQLMVADDKFPNVIGTGWEALGKKHCPLCGRVLKEAELKQVPGLRIDLCPECDGVWFDDGELRALVEAQSSTN